MAMETTVTAVMEATTTPGMDTAATEAMVSRFDSVLEITLHAYVKWSVVVDRDCLPFRGRSRESAVQTPSYSWLSLALTRRARVQRGQEPAWPTANEAPTLLKWNTGAGWRFLKSNWENSSLVFSFLLKPLHHSHFLCSICIVIFIDIRGIPNS